MNLRVQRLRAGIALSTLVLAGCVSGPNYKVPDTAAINSPAAQAGFAGGGDKAFSSAPLPDHWWRLYNDPQLDRLVTEALAANTDLRAADANLRAASAAVREVEIGRTVQTTVGGGASLARPSGTGISLPGVVDYDLGGSVTYPLDLAGRIRRSIEAAQADAEVVAATRDEVRVTVAAATTRAYVAACSANLQINAARRILTIQRQTYDATRRLERGGRGTAFDTTRAQSAVRQSEALVPGYLAARQAALFELAALTGRTPADYPRDVEQCAAIPETIRPIPVGDGAALLRRRPDIRAAERNLAAATAQIGVAVAGLYPTVSLGGSTGFTGRAEALGKGDDFHLSLGPLISWSFPNRKAVRAQIEQAGAYADAALANYDGAVLESLRQTETALSTYARVRDEVAALGNARDSAVLASQQAGKLFRFGRGDFLDLLSAQATLASDEASLAAAQAALADTQVSLFLALGGGWADGES